MVSENEAPPLRLTAEQIGDVLTKHIEHFRDGDYVDRSAINCSCGERWEPDKDFFNGNIRNWKAYYIHLGQMVLDEDARLR